MKKDSTSQERSHIYIRPKTVDAVVFLNIVWGNLQYQQQRSNEFLRHL